MVALTSAFMVARSSPNVIRLNWSTHAWLGAYHGPCQFVITSAETRRPAAWAAVEISLMQVVIAGTGGPCPDQGPSSMSRSMPSKRFEVAKPTRFWTNCARFVLLQARPQLLFPAPPIAMIALMPRCACTVATQVRTLMLWMLLLSRPGPFSVARLNRMSWLMTFHGNFAGGTGAQPRSSVMT